MTNIPETPQLPTRKPLRYAPHDYSGGMYFVTVCTQNKAHHFGEINGDVMHHSPIGRFLEHEIESLPSHYTYAEIPLWVVMPNHIHMVVCIKDSDTHNFPQKRTALSIIVAALKRSVTLFARRHAFPFAWQRSFHDHIIRDTRDGNHISDYITHNVARWAADRYK